MKKIIITQEQFKKINEDTTTLLIQADGNTPSDVKTALQNNRAQIDNSMANCGGDASIEVQTPEANDAVLPQGVNVNKGENLYDIEINPQLLNKSGKVRISGPGVGNNMQESVRFTKRQLEEIRKRLK